MPKDLENIVHSIGEQMVKKSYEVPINVMRVAREVLEALSLIPHDASKDEVSWLDYTVDWVNVLVNMFVKSKKSTIMRRILNR